MIKLCCECKQAPVSCACAVCDAEVCEMCFDDYHGNNCEKLM